MRHQTKLSDINVHYLPLEVFTLYGIQMDKHMKYSQCGPIFKWCLKIWPFDDHADFCLLTGELVWYLDPHCSIYIFIF